MVQILHEKDFLSNVDYLKQLVKELNSKSFSDYDSNLIYELIYAETYCTTFLSQVKNPKLAETVADIQMGLQIIMSNIDSSHIKSATSSSEYKKLLSMRYNNVEDASYEEEKPYSYVDGASPISLYLKKRLPSVVTAFIMPLVIMSGAMTKFTNFIFNVLYGSYSSTADSVSHLTPVIGSMTNIISFLLGLVCTLIVVCTSLSLILDLMYLSLPFVRHVFNEMGQTGKMVSIEAKSAIMNFEGHTIQYKKIRNYDRVQRNMYWLNAMLRVCEFAQLSGVGYDANLHNSLIAVSESIENNKLKDVTYYKDLVKIELLHEQYMKGTGAYAM